MLRSTAVLNENVTIEDDSVLLALCKVGTLASDGTGKVFELTEAALKSGATSWKGGFIKANHDFPLKGIISEAWWEPPYVMGRLEGIDPLTREIMSSAAYRGVSQDSLPLKVEGVRQVKYKGNNQLKSLDVQQVKAVSGTGVSLIFYPYTPACPMSAGCGVPLKSEAIEGMPGNEVVYEYDVGKLNNAGRMVKIKEIRVWLDGEETNDPNKLKEGIASEAGWGQLGVFNVYPRNIDLQIGDEITGVDPVHVISTIVSKSPISNPPLYTNSTEIPTEPHGGPKMGEPTIPTIEELQAKIATLEAEKADLSAQTAKIPDLVEAGVKAGLASAAIEQLKQKEHDEVAMELKSCMPETFDEFMALNPSVEIIKGAIKGIRSHNPAGAAKGTQQKPNSLYSSGKDLYDKLGVTEEQLAKYNEVE